jgi:hypothetical protein
LSKGAEKIASIYKGIRTILEELNEDNFKEYLYFCSVIMLMMVLLNLYLISNSIMPTDQRNGHTAIELEQY